MTKQTLLIKSYIASDNTLNRRYRDIIVNQDDFINWMADRGFIFSEIWGTECHDIGDQDYFSGRVKTSDVTEILDFAKKLYGEWSIEGTYKGAKLYIAKIGVNFFAGLYFKYPADAKTELEPLFAEFEEAFCSKDIKVCEES